MIESISSELENRPLNFPAIPETLAAGIRSCEAEAFASDVFTNPKSALGDKVRGFYERLVVFLTDFKDFQTAESKFTVLYRLYQLQGQNVSGFQAKMLSLRLLFLFVSGRINEFQTLLLSLPPSVQNSIEVKKILEFEQLVDLGNYKRAFEVVDSLSSSHKVLLERMKELQKIEFAYQDLQDDRS